MIYRDYTATERCVKCGKWRDYENPSDCTCMVFSAPSGCAEKRIPYYIGGNGVAGMLKPILFSTPMVRAILAGNKTMTRRVIPGDNEFGVERDQLSPTGFATSHGYPVKPRYSVGDTLWVRETWREKISTVCDVCAIRNPTLACKSKCAEYLYRADTDCTLRLKWKPSIHMPRKAARIFLRVTGVRAERVQDISEEDADAEGYGDDFCIHCGSCAGGDCYNPREWFQELWQDINGKRGFGWGVNPLVFCYNFNVVGRP